MLCIEFVKLVVLHCKEVGYFLGSEDCAFTYHRQTELASFDCGLSCNFVNALHHAVAGIPYPRAKDTHGNT